MPIDYLHANLKNSTTQTEADEAIEQTQRLHKRIGINQSGDSVL